MGGVMSKNFKNGDNNEKRFLILIQEIVDWYNRSYKEGKKERRRREFLKFCVTSS